MTDMRDHSEARIAELARRLTGVTEAVRQGRYRTAAALLNVVSGRAAVWARALETIAAVKRSSRNDARASNEHGRSL